MTPPFQQLRPIVALVCTAVALPLVATVNMPVGWRRAVLPIFVVASGLWTFLFYQLRKGRKSRAQFLLCGLALGLVPAAVFYVAGFVSQQLKPPIAMVVIGVVTGVFGGVALYDLVPLKRDKN